MPEITKSVQEKDIAGVGTLLRTYWKDRGMVYTQSWTEKYIQQSHLQEIKKEQWFSLKEKDKVIGIIAVLLREGNVAELRDLVIKKEYRNKGYGKKLLQRVLDWCRINNVRKIYMLTPQQARIFFEKERIKLMPANAAMSPIYTTHVKIQGKVVGLIRKYVN